MTDTRRHMWIPDTQIRPGVPTEHIDAAANAIVHYKPDVLVVAGDWWDMPSCSRWMEKGTLEREGARIRADLDAGNEAFGRLVKPMYAECARLVQGKRKRWDPICDFHFGNHEDRLDRYVNNNPELQGMFSREQMLTPGFNRHEFLTIVERDGISYSHYFANQLSGRSIGGTIPNRLNKIGRTFVQGHEQGFLYGVQQYPGKVTRSGLVAGSFYMHDEKYRGLQSNGEWRGVVVLNEVREGGKYDIMPLTMDYLLRKFI